MHSIVNYSAKLLGIAENSKGHFNIEEDKITMRTRDDFNLEYSLLERHLYKSTFKLATLEEIWLLYVVNK